MLTDPCRTPVLFIVLEFSATMLGGSRSLSYIIKHMQRFKPHVLCLNPGEFHATLQAAAIPTTLMNVIQYPFDNIRRQPLTYKLKLLARLLRSNAYVFRLLKKHDFQVVHCNSIYDFLHAFFGIKAAGRGLVLNIRATHPHDTMKWHWQIALLASSKVVVLSTEMQQYYVERTWRWYRRRATRKIHTIYSAVPFHEVETYSARSRESYRQSLGLPQDACIIAYVGSVIPRKMQLEVLKRVVIPVSRQVPHVLFCFVGGVVDGDPLSVRYWEACLHTVQERGLQPWVRFVGHQSEVYSWFMAADFSALASTFEGLPRVLIESLACCRPVVSTAVTSAREILTQYACGLVARQNDWPGITDQILRLCQDAPLRERMSATAGQVARQLFNAEAVAGQYEALYRELTRR